MEVTLKVLPKVWLNRSLIERVRKKEDLLTLGFAKARGAIASNNFYGEETKVPTKDVQKGYLSLRVPKLRQN